MSIAELKAGMQNLGTLREEDRTAQCAYTSQGKDEISLTLEALQPSQPRALSPEDLLGCWSDSNGSAVVVQSSGEGLSQLITTLIRMNKPDVNLVLWQTFDGKNWYCGGAKLDLSRTSHKRIAWVFPDGRVSIWKWQGFTLEALAVRGLALPLDQPKESFMSGRYAQVWMQADGVR